jgi:hypothetical protein
MTLNIWAMLNHQRDGAKYVDIYQYSELGEMSKGIANKILEEKVTLAT